MTKEVLVKIPFREERVFLALFLKGLAVLLIACVCLSAFAVTEEDIVIDLSGEPASLDPHVQWNPSSYYVYRNIFDNLFTRDNEGKIVGQVAETWEQTTDTTLKLTIREGIFFHDGKPLKPSDVVFSIKRIIDPEFGSPQLGQFNKIVDAVAEKNTVIIFTHNNSCTNLLEKFAGLSKHVPTCGILIFDFDVSLWDEIDTGKCDFYFPKHFK